MTNSITTRLIVILTACLATIFAVGMLLDYRLSRAEILERLRLQSADTIDSAVTDMENWLDGVEGSTLEEVLANAGLAPADVARVCLAHPPLRDRYDLEEEVKPRINYMRFLSDNDRLGGETVRECILRQPQALERRFGVCHEDAEYVVRALTVMERVERPDHERVACHGFVGSKVAALVLNAVPNLGTLAA